MSTPRKAKLPHLNMGAPPQAKPKKRPPPTLAKFLSDMQKAMGFQLQTLLAQFLETYTDEDLEAFLPENPSEADDWIEGHINAFLENEEPTIGDMTDGLGAFFVMAFLEQLYEHCQVEDGDEEDGDEEDDEDDGDEDEN